MAYTQFSIPTDWNYFSGQGGWTFSDLGLNGKHGCVVMLLLAQQGGVDLHFCKKITALI